MFDNLVFLLQLHPQTSLHETEYIHKLYVIDVVVCVLPQLLYMSFLLYAPSLALNAGRQVFTVSVTLSLIYTGFYCHRHTIISMLQPQLSGCHILYIQLMKLHSAL